MVTVIIPNYDHALYLKERIDSVLNQSYQDFEVIILDDKSSDNSRDIIETYRHHPKVASIVFNKENSGSTFRQWQKGFEIAKGDYIWIAESDDVAHPDFLEKVMEPLEKDKDIVLCFTALQGIDGNGKKLSGYTLPTYTSQTVMSGKDFIRKNMIFGCHILNASSAVFRKDTLEFIAKDYMEFKTAGDYLFWIEIASQGKVVKVPEILDYFRQHNNKVTPNAVRSGLQFQEAKRILHKLDEKGLLTPIQKRLAIGFWLHRMDKEKNKFASTQIYHEVKDEWEGSYFQQFLYKSLYMLNGIGRTINKKLLKHSL